MGWPSRVRDAAPVRHPWKDVFGVSRQKSPFLRWIPITLFLASLAAAFNSEGVLSEFGIEASSPVQAWWKNSALTLSWIFGAALLNQLVRWTFWDRIVARAIGGPVPGVLKELSSVVVYLVAITCIVGFVFDRSVMGFLAALGAGGVVLGFALRDLFADIFTGLAINIDRTFVIGDWVQINEGTAGPTIARIQEIGWRCTSLVTEEQTTVVVPNGMLGQERMVNISQPIEPTRYELDVTVEFSVPSRRVKRVLLASIKALSREPGYDATHEPVVLIGDTSALGVEYVLRYWILPWDPQSPTTWRNLVLESALRHLRSAGISLAYPKSDVYHSRLPERQVEGHSAADEANLLSRIHLFHPLRAEEIGELAESLRRRLAEPGHTLVHVGERGDSLFIVIEGLLSVRVEKDGSLQQVALLEPGEFFGEMSLLTGERRSATVECVTEAVVYEIGKESLQRIMERRPEVAEHLARILAERQLLTRQALERHDQIRETEEFESLARQLLVRMRDFLGGSRLSATR
jgi:small-conductance mechanosensitive channel/CRP-like cAMP-binding protein